MENDFEIVKMVPQYPVDLTALDRTYQDLQRQYHPDQFLLENEQVQQQATLQASIINDAYRRLRNPLTAAEAFFQVEFSIDALNEVTGLPEFLFHMLDMGEKIELAEKAKDIERLSQLSDILRGEIDQQYQAVTEGFNEKDKDKAAVGITHWKYLKKALDNLEEKIDIIVSSL